MLKNIVFIFFLFFIMAMAGCSKDSRPLLKDNTGQSMYFSELRGHWVIINYWAVWCDTCKKEIPSLNLLYKKIKNKKIKLFGVNYDGLKDEKLKNAIQQFNIQYPVLLSDPNHLFGLGKIAILPMTFIINPEGRVIKKLIGPQSVKTIETIISLDGEGL